MFPAHNAFLSLIVLATALSNFTVTCLAADPRTIALEVRLISPTGSQPETGVPVNVDMCVRDWRRSITDSQGIARFSFEVPDGCGWLRVDISKLPTPGSGFTSQMQEMQRVEKFERAWSFPGPIDVQLSPAQSSYSVEIPLAPAITITGKVVGSGGERRGVRVDREGRMAAHLFRGWTSGKFQVPGVPKAKASLLYLFVSNDTTRSLWIRIQELSAAQAEVDADVGTIVDDPPIETIACSVTLTDFRTPPPNRSPYGGSLVAVRSDGKYAIPRSFWREAEGLDPSTLSLTLTLQIPAGTWYLFPGQISDLRMVPAICRLLTGDTAAIDAANIPKVVVTAAQPPAPAPSVTIDFWPTLERMLKITPPPPPAPPPAPLAP